MTNKERKKMIAEVAEFYKVPSESPNMSDPEVLDAITARAMDKCKEKFKAIDAGIAASLAHASEIWTC